MDRLPRSVAEFCGAAQGQGGGQMVGSLGRTYKEPRDHKADRVGRAGIVAGTYQ